MDWTTAQPIDVEREVRRRLGMNPRAVFMHKYVNEPEEQVVSQYPDDEPYIYDIAAVLRDVLPRMYPPKLSNGDGWVRLSMQGDGSGHLCHWWGTIDEPDKRITEWDSLDAAPLEICRAFCQMPGGSDE